MDIDYIEVIKVVATILALLIAIIGHEIMHGLIAYKYGDITAKQLGRLSINPIPHIDIVGSIILPLSLYLLDAPFILGWAKPVPVNINQVIQNGGYLGALNVSLAGVLYNFILAIVSSIILNSFSEPQDLTDVFIYYLFFQLVIINVVLGVFNLWIVPKFDGANAFIYISLMLGTRKVADFYSKIENYSLIILLIIFMIPQFQELIFSPALWIWRELLLN